MSHELDLIEGVDYRNDISIQSVRDQFPKRDEGWVVSIKESANKGKTAVAAALAFDLVNFHGYRPDEVYCNFILDMPGFNYCTPEGMRKLLRAMARIPLAHKVAVIDEINSIFPSRFFKDPKQTEDLLGLWQATKLGNWVIFTGHLGTAMDKIIRDSRQIQLMPDYDQKTDTIHVYEINGIDVCNELWVVENASELFKLYWRWEPIGVRLRTG